MTETTKAVEGSRDDESRPLTEIEQLHEILTEDYWVLSGQGDNYHDFTTVLREIYDHSRWSVTYRVVTRGPSGKYYEWFDDQGATDMQDSDGFLGDLVEVEPFIAQVTQYRKVAQ